LSFVDQGRALPAQALRTGLLEQRLLLIQPRLAGAALWHWAGWNRRNRARVARGFHAYQQGDLRLMRRHFVQAVVHNPLVLGNLGIVSLLIESMVGSTTMTRYRTWRHSR